MKITEKILIIIWIIFLLLRGVDYNEGTAFFGLATFALGLYYLFGSFKLFEPDNNSSLLIPILAGLSLATSIITIPFNISLQNSDWLQIFPFINIIFTAFLLGLIGLRLIRKKKIASNLKSMLLRASIVLIITCFFAFRLTGNTIYRETIIFLNAGNHDMINNMRMIDFWEKAEEELERENCEQAIEYALKSFNEGLNWLFIDTDNLEEKDIKQLWQIQATYTTVYKAFDCKAEKLYYSKNYNEALYYQLKADSFLNINPIEQYSWWKKERASSKNKIGLCYDRLYMSDSAASYFAKSIKYHIDSVGEFNKTLSMYLINLAHSLSDGLYWNESNQAAKQSILILDNDSISADKNGNYASSYLQLVHNALAENKLNLAKEYLSRAKQYLSSDKYCKYHLYNSILANKLDNPFQTLNYAEKAKICFLENFGEQYQNVAESHLMLFDAWTTIPNYDSALANIKRGKEITRINHGSNSVRFHNYVKREAYYYYLIGNYNESLKKLEDVKNVYESTLGPESNKLPEVLATIAQIKIEQSGYDEAKKYSKESLLLANQHDFFVDEQTSSLLNNIAFVHYATNQVYIADTLYKRSIELNISAERDSSLSVASALNGLGLLATKKFEFIKADSLYNLSLEYYKKHFSDLHPDIGIVLMNKSELQFRKRNSEDALELINIALENFTKFHKNNHPTIGDMFALKASILIMDGEHNQAQNYLIKALEIYELNFQSDHVKIKETRKRLAALDRNKPNS